MKTANILKLLCVVSMFYISCSKMEGPDYCGDDAVYVFKLRDTSYINYILVEYDKKEVRLAVMKYLLCKIEGFDNKGLKCENKIIIKHE